jgi:hypothetical protein
MIKENINEQNKEEFKKAIKIFSSINLGIFLLLFLCFFPHQLESIISSLTVTLLIFPFIQFIHLIPTVIFCLVKKKYALMKGALIVSGLTLLLCPVTCFGGGFFLSQITK